MGNTSPSFHLSFLFREVGTDHRIDDRGCRASGRVRRSLQHRERRSPWNQSTNVHGSDHDRGAWRRGFGKPWSSVLCDLSRSLSPSGPWFFHSQQEAIGPSTDITQEAADRVTVMGDVQSPCGVNNPVQATLLPARQSLFALCPLILPGVDWEAPRSSLAGDREKRQRTSTSLCFLVTSLQPGKCGSGNPRLFPFHFNHLWSKTNRPAMIKGAS